jgi:serine protease Do
MHLRPLGPRHWLTLWTAVLLIQWLALAATAHATDIVQTIARIKPAVVGVGTLIKTRNPAFQLMGTGFAVADGLHIITNAHTYAKPLDGSVLEVPMVLVPTDGIPQQREAQIVAVDRNHDLALLRISGNPLPVMTLGDSSTVREGQMLAFTGYPLAIVLGLHPATHRGMVSALVPVVLPGITARQLTDDIIRRLRHASYRVIQLDGTAYPGNSGSPLYDPENGVVYGIINKVFVQAGRESAINLPSGITYAIPSIHIDELLRREKVPGHAPR